MEKDIGCRAIQTLEASSLKASQTSSVDSGRVMSVTSMMLDRDMYMCLSTRYDGWMLRQLHYVCVLYCASITYIHTSIQTAIAPLRCGDEAYA